MTCPKRLIEVDLPIRRIAQTRCGTAGGKCSEMFGS